MSLLPNLDELNDEQKMDVLESVQKSIAQSKEIQKRKIAENVDLVVQALKKIESDIRSRYDDVGNAIEKRVASIKDGRDGIDGKDGRDGKDGKQGKDGRPGRDGKDGKNGLDGQNGEDGVSVVNAHIDFDGSLIISLSTGKEINVGEVVAPALAEQIKVITNGGGTSQSVLDTLTSLQSQIDALSGATIYKGLWNASTNTPALTSSVGTSGNFYIVSVAGSTNLNGITNWDVGDWAIFNGSVWQRVEGGANGNFVNLSISGTTTLSGLTASTALALDSSKNVVSVTNTGTGNNVLATSPVLVTPNLGTPTAITLTSGTGLPISTGVSGLGTGVATALAVNTGTSGAFVVNGGALGTPSSGTVTNLTGTASININGTVGATTPNTGAFTTLSASGVATFSAGTVSAPAITTSGDTNTGVYFPAADTVGITAGGTQRGAFSATGLAVTGALSASGTITANSNPGLIVSNGYQELYRTTNDATSLAHLVFYRGSGAGTFAGINTIGNAANGVASLVLTISGTTIAAVSSTGLAVTGTISATGVATFAAGTAALPSITTTGDTNTGVYFPAADTVGITTGGTERMQISSAGLVGIGTATPLQRLHVVGNVGVNTGVAPGGNGSGIAVFASDFPRLSLRNTTTGDLNSDGFQMYMVGNDAIYNLLESGYQAFFTAAVERMRIDSSGNVGIGTSSPGARLDVTSSAAFSARITGPANAYFDLTDGTGTFRAQMLSNSPFLTSIGTYPFVFGTNNTERMRIDSSGNVGIGTSSPAYKLDVSGQVRALEGGTGSGDGGLIGSTGSANGNAGVLFQTNATSRWNLTTQGTNGANLRFYNYALASTVAIFDASGNLGIGTSSPTAKLDVSSDVFRLRTAKTPASASATGNAGDICWDSSYIYVCTATNTWKRVAIATW